MFFQTSEWKIFASQRLHKQIDSSALPLLLFCCYFCYLVVVIVVVGPAGLSPLSFSHFQTLLS